MTADPLPGAADLAGRLRVRVEVHDAVGSTMDVARDDPGPSPAIHLAERQKAGRGRSGRRWESPPGNLYATIAWPDPEGTIPPGVLGAIQVAWSRAVEAEGGPRTACKWPNDGIVAGGKWAGAMAVRAAGPGGRRLLVGLGANLTDAPRLEAARPAVALAERWRPWPGRARVVPLLLDAALGILRGGPRAIVDALAGWDRRDALEPGEAIAVEVADGVRRGRYRGVSPDGRLRLETPEGTIVLAAGEVTRLLAPG